MSQGVIAIDFIGTKENTADPLTKGLNANQVQFFRLGMGLKPIENSTIAATQPN